jgi:hypothetical protein
MPVIEKDPATMYLDADTPDPRPGFYYVTCTDDGKRFAIVCGPYDAHADALADVDRVKREADKLDIKSCWYGWGTVRSETPFAKTPPIARKS